MKTKNVWLRFPPTDMAEAISRATLSRLAACVGMTETKTTHYALKLLAQKELPAYEPDEGSDRRENRGYPETGSSRAHEVDQVDLILGLVRSS